jgi:hypothetical protein
MTAQAVAIVSGASFLAANEITNVCRRFTSDGALTVTHADRRQPLPFLDVTDAEGAMNDAITTILLTTVPAFALLIDVVLQAREVAVQRLLKLQLDVFEQVFLVVFDSQRVVAASFQNLGGNGLLAAHGVDGHQGAVQVEQLQERRDGRDFIGFHIDRYLSQRQVLCGGPSADQVQRAELGRAGAAQRLTIDGDVLDLERSTDGFHPVAETGLEGLGAETLEDSFERVMRRNAVGQLQKAAQPILTLTAKGLDLLPILGISDDGTQRNDNDILQLV